MSTDPKWCSQCGFWNCPHDAPKIEPSPIVLPTDASEYDPSICHSLDHKSPMVQMQGVDLAMRRYFGDTSDVENLLNYRWLEERRKQFPGLK